MTKLVNLYKYRQELIENKANSPIFSCQSRTCPLLLRTCPGGEIGRHRGFKIPALKACRFESGPGHHFQLLNLVLQRIQRKLVFMPNENDPMIRILILISSLLFISSANAEDIFNGTILFKINIGILYAVLSLKMTI